MICKICNKKLGHRNKSGLCLEHKTPENLGLKCTDCGAVLLSIKMLGVFSPRCRPCGLKNSWTKERRLARGDRGRQLWKDKDYIEKMNIRDVQMSILRTGKMKSDETKKKISISVSKLWLDENYRNNQIEKAVNRQECGYSCVNKGWFESTKNAKKIVYQSGLELKAIMMFENNKKIKSFDRANFGGISYLFEDKFHKYVPDFKVHYENDDIHIIEIKPLRYIDRIRNKAKEKAAMEYCNKNNLSYKILTERQLEEYNVC